MASWQIRLAEKICSMTRFNKMFQKSEQELIRFVEKQARKRIPPPPKAEDFHCETRRYGDRPCYIFRRKAPQGNNRKKRVLFYIHGGGYIMEITSFQWRLAVNLARETESMLVTPYYPLAPANPCNRTFEMLLPIYRDVLQETGKNAEIHLIGDSAGGGIALSLAQLLKEKWLPAPENIILCSPVLSLTQPTEKEWAQMQKIAPMDCVLAPEFVKILGKWWSGERLREHYYVSPMYGDLSDIGPISLFTGTHDILNVYAREFYEKAARERVKLHYYEYPEMPHVWMGFPAPEARQTRSQIRKIILSR